MQITCAICREALLADQYVVVTTCGHLYHYRCLSLWVYKKEICPQCRAELNTKPLRVYFNINDDLDSTYKEGLLETKCAEITSRLEVALTEFQKMKTLTYEAEEKNKKSEKQIKIIEKLNFEYKVKMSLITQQLSASLEKNKQYDKIKEEHEKITLEIELLRRIKLLVDGTEDVVKEWLENTPCTPEALRQLLTYLEILKKQSKRNVARCKSLIESHRLVLEELSKVKEENKALHERIEEYHNHFLNTKTKTPPPEPQAPAPKPSFDPADMNWCGNVPIRLINKPPPRKPTGLMFNRVNNACLPSSSATASSPRPGFAYDGMGGSKRISLAQPTPAEELKKIRSETSSKRKRVKSIPRKRKLVPLPDIEDCESIELD